MTLTEANILKTAINKVKNLGSKELTPKESLEMVKNLIKTESKSLQPMIKTGALLMFKYDAKDKDQKYDKTPLVMVLSKTSKYMLGVNFHWMPSQYRQVIVEYILKRNSKQIRNKMPLKMKYKDLRGVIKSIGAFPVIRLYIRGRMSSKGVKIPDELLSQACKLKTETFTKGRANSTTLWGRAKQKALSAKRKILK